MFVMDLHSKQFSDRNHIPPHFTMIFSPEQISLRTEELGRAISPWAVEVSQTTGQDVVAVAVLRGGIFFFADLVRAISTSVEVAPVKTVGYDPKNNKGLDTVSVIADSLEVKGRHILLVDDICDSGRTFERLVPLLLERGAEEVRSTVLVRKILPHKTFLPDWVGFEFTGDDWLVGFGMDDKERWRNLPAVYGMKPPVGATEDGKGA
jgi:hypoxanthine phosphoribosyltransferase